MFALPHGSRTPMIANAAALTAEAGPTAVAPAVPLELEAIYEEHFDYVWRSIRQLGVDEANADDAVQDVFVVVHRRLSTFEARSSLKTWLFGIALRVARDHRRRFGRKDGRQQPLSFELGDTAPGPYERLETSEAVRVFERLLESLDDHKREVFVLAEVEQLTAPEIGELLGIPLNTVYSRLRVARQAFNHALREREGAGDDPR
jgi:RNA polymerase sigma-70 factor (ECF subfamily)